MDEKGTLTGIDAIRITLDHEKLHATAVLTKEMQSFSPEMVADALASAGIIFGIDHARFGDVGRQPGRPVVVAEGTAPAQGRPGWVECLVSPPQLPAGKEGDNTRMVFKVLNVRKGEPVVQLHEPEVGADGISVTGEPIMGRRGVPVAVTAGPGVTADPQAAGRYLATVDGNLVIEGGGKVEVRDTIEFSDSLDITMGDIDFVGSLIVRGDIHGDINIKVGKNLTVFGDVADAVIVAGGDVIVRNGFMGRGAGSITAGGSVRVQHVRNQHISAGNEVHIERESVNGTITAKRKIEAAHAVIAGGVLEADEVIEVGMLGRVEGGQVKVRVGRRGKIIDRLASMEKELRQLEKNFADIKDAVYKLVRMKIDAGKLSSDKETMLARLQEAQRQIPGKREQLLAEQSSLNAELQRHAEVKLTVHDTISDNVFIDVNGARKLTDAIVRGVVYTERNGELQATGL